MMTHEDRSVEDDIQDPPPAQLVLVKFLRRPLLASIKLKALYQFVDEVFSYSKGLVACHSGCAACCHMPVEMYQVEADNIAAHAGRRAIRLKRDRAFEPAWVDRNRGCPFLRNNTCSIYEQRPLTCRMHFNFDATPAMCNESIAEPNRSKIPLLDRSRLFPAILVEYLAFAGRHGKRGDIRHFFPSEDK